MRKTHYISRVNSFVFARSPSWVEDYNQQLWSLSYCFHFYCFLLLIIILYIRYLPEETFWLYNILQRCDLEGYFWNRSVAYVRYIHVDNIRNSIAVSLIVLYKKTSMSSQSSYMLQIGGQQMQCEYLVKKMIITRTSKIITTKKLATIFGDGDWETSPEKYVTV